MLTIKSICEPLKQGRNALYYPCRVACKCSVLQLILVFLLVEGLIVCFGCGFRLSRWVRLINKPCFCLFWVDFSTENRTKVFSC
jgi:hypothetical protein